MKQNILLILCSATMILVAASCKKKDDRSRQSGAYVVSMTVSGPAAPSKPADGASLKSGTMTGGQPAYNPQGFDPYPLLYSLSSLFFVSLFVRTIKFQKQNSPHSRSGFSSGRS